MEGQYFFDRFLLLRKDTEIGVQPSESGRLAMEDLAVRRNPAEVQLNGGFPLSLDNLHRQRGR